MISLLPSVTWRGALTQTSFLAPILDSIFHLVVAQPYACTDVQPRRPDPEMVYSFNLLRSASAGAGIRLRLQGC